METHVSGAASRMTSPAEHVGVASTRSERITPPPNGGWRGSPGASRSSREQQCKAQPHLTELFPMREKETSWHVQVTNNKKDS